MHPSTISRRHFLALSGTAAAGSLFSRFRAAACPNLEEVAPTANVAGAINAFATDLHARLARDEKGSLFFSPFSTSTALAMTSAGARGETLAEMEKTLHLPSEPHQEFGELTDRFNKSCRRPYELSVANAIWAQKGYPWRKEFTDLTRKHYGASTVETDFKKSEAARKEINNWVEDETRKRIKELIGPNVITPLTRMVLANAIYFKSDWQTKFDKKNTKDAAFTRADETTAAVPLMSATSTFNYGEFDMPTRRPERVQVLEMPYVGKELSMLIYLPEHANGLNRLGLWLTPEQLAKPELQSREVIVAVPRFKVEASYSLKPALVDLGMKAAFDPEKADFTGLSPEGKGLHITHVLHKAFVEVNEEGSEAAAASAVVIAKPDGVRNSPPVFRADRPFAFAIRDNKSGATLFLGRYAGPK